MTPTYALVVEGRKVCKLKMYGSVPWIQDYKLSGTSLITARYHLTLLLLFEAEQKPITTRREIVVPTSCPPLLYMECMSQSDQGAPRTRY